MYEIPLTVNLEGVEFPIRNKGDYRMVLDCLIALDDPELSKEERILSALIIFYEDLNSVDDVSEKLPNTELAFTEMCKFFNCGQLESLGATVNYKLIDWDRDSQLISSAINKVANTEIRSLPYLHWWTFMGYYLAVGESALATIVGIRNKIMKGKKLEKYEKQFKQDNPQYFVWNSSNVDKLKLDEEARALWNSGK